MTGRSVQIAVVSAVIVIGEPNVIKVRECVLRDVRLDMKEYTVTKVRYQLICIEKEIEE